MVGLGAVRPRRPVPSAGLLAHGPALGGGVVIVFARHGRTEVNRGGRLQGRIDAPLDELGPRRSPRPAAPPPRRAVRRSDPGGHQPR
ncbi:MAG: histidine phosphatase family protein [Actinomycetota bacterium]